MRYIKPLLFIVAILFSTVSVAKFNDSQSNSWHEELDSNQTILSYQIDPSKTLNQEMLLTLSKGNEISSIFNTLDDEELSDKKSINVVYKSNYLTMKLYGKLICVSDKGIFVYLKNTLTYIPYKYIKLIRRGMNFGKQIGIAVAAGGGSGFVYGLTETWPVIMGIVYGVYGAAVGGFYYLVIGGPINLIASTSRNVKFEIMFNEENGKSYLKMINENSKTYGNRMQVKDYPGTVNNDSINSNIPQNKIDTTFIIQEKSRKLDSTKIANNTVLTTVEISKSTKDSVVAEIPKAAPAQLKVEFPNLNTPTDKINPTWMYWSFNKFDVNEKKLMSKFKNIQGTQMFAENLQNLNPSEIQYLAITIATLNGYNFRNIANFSESQSQNLKNYESYISYEIKSDSDIDPTNLQELDLGNIKLIYSVLKEKNN
jgi:hypothetical protein